jgi:hypothetical protein
MNLPMPLPKKKLKKAHDGLRPLPWPLHVNNLIYPTTSLQLLLYPRTLAIMKLSLTTMLAAVLFLGPTASLMTPRGVSHRVASALALTADEILANARARTGINVEESAPAPVSLFDDDLFEDMRLALLTLERRVQEGPGALRALDVEELGGQLTRIAQEMKVNEHKKHPKPPVRQESAGGLQQQQSTTATAVETTQLARQSTNTGAPSNVAVEYNPEEGEAFSGQGGMGQPRGTVNTYVIPGMDEMTAEEYQEKLQASVSGRQAKRRADGAVVGNCSSRNYMAGLQSNNNNGDNTKDEKKSYWPGQGKGV